jgi:hypothetical protein
MTTPEALARLENLLGRAFQGQDRLTSEDLRRHAVEAELPAEAMALLDRLPEGEYAQDEAAEALRQVPRLSDGEDRT